MTEQVTVRVEPGQDGDADTAAATVIEQTVAAAVEAREASRSAEELAELCLNLQTEVREQTTQTDLLRSQLAEQSNLILSISERLDKVAETAAVAAVASTVAVQEAEAIQEAEAEILPTELTVDHTDTDISPTEGRESADPVEVVESPTAWLRPSRKDGPLYL